MYNSNKQGTKIGSLVNTSDTRELTITGDYAYIGLRSNNGAVYMLNISIDWFSESADTYSGYCTTLATTVPVTITAAGAVNAGGAGPASDPVISMLPSPLNRDADQTWNTDSSIHV